MEQHRTRPQQHGPRRGRPPVPPARRPPAARRPAAAAAAPEPAPRRPSAPRLTGLGAGLFCGAVMFLLGGLDVLLLGGGSTVYGVLFLPVCALTALWVRKGDLLTAPVVVPIGFAVGLLPVINGDTGFLGKLMSLVTALATQAPWLYAGTMIAGVTALVRRVILAARRRAMRRRMAG
ncbi:DUF6542 domain-containing protein [Streptomyces sp. NPDC014889]|uniref:DUF6542 domain-containing protein n=1 Tax=Streptomyces sp. NPDC014889 TaxID=3364928 RepID=UPI0036FBC889